MATKTIQRYDHPNFTVVRHDSAICGNATANDIFAGLSSYQKGKLKSVACQVHTSGTGTAGGTGNLTLILQNGTTSIGAFTMGTALLGVTSRLTFTTAFAADTFFNVKQVTDVTARSVITYEWEVEPGSTVTK